MQDSEQESIEANSLLKYSPRDISTPISSRGAVLVAGREAQCARGGGESKVGGAIKLTAFAGGNQSISQQPVRIRLLLQEPNTRSPSMT